MTLKAVSLDFTLGTCQGSLALYSIPFVFQQSLLKVLFRLPAQPSPPLPIALLPLGQNRFLYETIHIKIQ